MEQKRKTGAAGFWDLGCTPLSASQVMRRFHNRNPFGVKLDLPWPFFVREIQHLPVVWRARVHAARRAVPTTGNPAQRDSKERASNVKASPESRWGKPPPSMQPNDLPPTPCTQCVIQPYSNARGKRQERRQNRCSLTKNRDGAGTCPTIEI